MEFVDGRLFLEKCQELGCPIYHKFEAFARHEFEKDVRVEFNEFKDYWLLNVTLSMWLSWMVSYTS